RVLRDGSRGRDARRGAAATLGGCEQAGPAGAGASRGRLDHQSVELAVHDAGRDPGARDRVRERRRLGACSHHKRLRGSVRRVPRPPHRGDRAGDPPGGPVRRRHDDGPGEQRADGREDRASRHRRDRARRGPRHRGQACPAPRERPLLRADRAGRRDRRHGDRTGGDVRSRRAGDRDPERAGGGRSGERIRVRAPLRDLHERPGTRAPVRRGGADRVGQRERGDELLGVTPAVRRRRRLAERHRAGRRPVLHGASDRAQDDRRRSGLSCWWRNDRVAGATRVGSIEASMQDRAQTVIVGAGIVGASAAYYLAELGQADVLVIDRGPLFETGGSTSHAPGLAFQTNGSRTMCRIAQDSVRLYAGLDVDGQPCWYGVGGIEVATTEARMAELRRRRGSAQSYGIEDVELLTSGQTADRIPLLDPSTILGSYFVGSDGTAKGVRIATALGRRASARGVAFEGEVAVTGFDVAGGHVRAVLTDHGRIDCERVLISAGIWGPTVGAMAGVPIPLLAVQHQLVWTDPLPELAGETREIVHPILRHQDVAMYFRQREDHYGVGSYHHEPIATPQPELPAPGGELQPAVMAV